MPAEAALVEQAKSRQGRRVMHLGHRGARLQMVTSIRRSPTCAPRRTRTAPGHRHESPRLQQTGCTRRQGRRDRAHYELRRELATERDDKVAEVVDGVGSTTLEAGDLVRWSSAFDRGFLIVRRAKARNVRIAMGYLVVLHLTPGASRRRSAGLAVHELGLVVVLVVVDRLGPASRPRRPRRR